MNLSSSLLTYSQWFRLPSLWGGETFGISVSLLWQQGFYQRSMEAWHFGMYHIHSTWTVTVIFYFWAHYHYAASPQISGVEIFIPGDKNSMVLYDTSFIFCKHLQHHKQAGSLWLKMRYLVVAVTLWPEAAESFVDCPVSLISTDSTVIPPQCEKVSASHFFSNTFIRICLHTVESSLI